MEHTIDSVVLAVDFDGTICTAAYPEIGRERMGAREFINQLYEDGYYIIIHTCRTDDGEYPAAQMAKDFLRIRDIKYHLFNENAKFVIDFYGCDTRKISADVYIDDKCLFDIPSWEEKYEIIKKRFPDPTNKNAR